MTVREYRAKDAPAVAEIFTRELGYEMGRRYLERRVQQMDAAGGYKVFVAEEKGQCVAFLGLCTGLAFEHEGGVARVIALGCKKEWQNRGAGTRLLSAAEKYARETGVEIVTLNSGLARQSAHEFYEKRGYNKKGYSFAKKL